MERRRVSSGSAWESQVGYSRAVRTGSTVRVAGTTAVDDDGEPMTDAGPAEQTTRAIEIVERALAEVDATLADVVRTRLFVTDIDDWEAIGRAHGAAFGEIRPAATMVEVQRLIEPGLVVEIEAEAVVG